MNLAQLIERNARQLPDHPALSVGQFKHSTWRELAAHVRAIAYNLLHVRRLLPGSCIGIAMSNAPEFWEVLFGAWYAGMIAVPINPKLHGREMEFILSHSGARLCFTTPDIAATVERYAPALAEAGGVICVGHADFRRVKAASIPNHDPIERSPQDNAWLFYTSGTTGRPKGAMLSHRNLLMMILAYLADIEQVVPTDCMVHGAPQSHGSGLYGLVHVARGANTIIPESGGFDPAEIASLMEIYRGMSMFAAPTMVNRLVACDAIASSKLSNLKTVIYGGAPMYGPDIRTALDILGPRLAQIYGQGESPMTITSLSKSQHVDSGDGTLSERLASVGIARTGVEVRVADQDAKSLPPGSVGEVLVRGDVVMSGYWHDTAATATVLRGGWLSTGDLGAFDSNGFLTLLDRSKDLIISGGSNIYPREIEDLLLRHPAISEVSVIGRPHPEWGEEVVAVIVCRDGFTVKAEELDRLCLENIARFKRPKAYEYVHSLPVNSTGKVMKTELRKMLKDRYV